MKCHRLFLLPILASFLLVGAATEARAIGIWHRDYGTARQEAKAGDKKLLIVFTGTDWIEICRKFYDEILGQPEFIDAVSGEFALLKLEYPKDNQLPREEAAQKALLREAYRVRGFPTIVLTDAEGRPFGLNGFQPVTPKEYADQLLGILKTHEENLAGVKAAAALEGTEKAKGISRGIPDLPGGLVARFYREEMAAVLQADPEDTLKLASTFGRLIAEDDYSREMQSLARGSKWAEMIALTNRHIEGQRLEGEALQGALLHRAGLEKRAGQDSVATETLRKVVEMDAESEPGKEAAELLKGGKDGPASPSASAPEAAVPPSDSSDVLPVESRAGL